MFFILSKTLGLLTVPSNVLGLLIALGLLAYVVRWRRTSRRILIFAGVLFLVVGMFPIGQGLIGVLEDRFPAWTETTGAPDGVIILGGPIRIGRSEARGTVELSEAAERFTVVPALARRYPNARIVFTGGSADLLGGTSEAPFARRLLESLGIPPDRLLIEDRSRNTAENARFTKEMVQPKPGEHWLLVTSAAHMPRAMGVFRKIGFPVEAYPVDWQTDGRHGGWWRWLKPSRRVFHGWDQADDAAKEWVGLLAYWLSGQTDALFPGPNLAAAAPGDKRP